jgi:peptide/nickel transport system permease protein
MTDSSSSTVEVAAGSRSTRRIGVVRRALGQGRTRLGLALTAFIVLVGVVGPLIAPHSPSEFVGPPSKGPFSGAPLGTDYLGQDVLSRVLWGGWSVLWMAIAATVIGVALGVVIGLVAASAGTVTDDLIMGATDVVLAFPQIVLVIVFVSMLGPELWLIVLLVAVSHAPRIARLVRALAAETMRKEYVEAAEVLGIPRYRILAGEVLPNLTTPLLVEASLRLVWSIGIVAGLSFLGYGIQPPNADWGLMINENRIALSVQPWAVVLPVLLIAIFAIGTSLVAEGLSRSIAGVDREAEV